MQHMQIPIDKWLQEALEVRTENGHPTDETILRDLRRYYEVLRLGTKEIQALSLTPDECTFLIGVFVSTAFEGGTIRLLPMSLEEAVANGEDEGLGVDGRAVLDKVRSLSPSGLFALADAFERNHCGQCDEITEPHLQWLGLIGPPDLGLS